MIYRENEQTYKMVSLVKKMLGAENQIKHLQCILQHKLSKNTSLSVFEGYDYFYKIDTQICDIRREANKIKSIISTFDYDSQCLIYDLAHDMTLVEISKLNVKPTRTLYRYIAKIRNKFLKLYEEAENEHI